MRIPTRSFASRFDSGSSIRNAAGSRTIARPIATRCCCPPESWPGPPVEELVEAEQLRDRPRTRSLALRLRRLADLQAVAEVLPHGHVRVERVVLEDHREVALAGLEPRHVAVADQDAPVGHLLEAADRAEQRRLAAAGRPDQDHELAVADREVDVVDRAHLAAAELLRHVVERDLTHGRNLSPSERKSAIVATRGEDPRSHHADLGERRLRQGHLQRLRPPRGRATRSRSTSAAALVLDHLAELGVERVTDVLMTHHHRDQVQGLAPRGRRGRRGSGCRRSSAS